MLFSSSLFMRNRVAHVLATVRNDMIVTRPRSNC